MKAQEPCGPDQGARGPPGRKLDRLNLVNLKITPDWFAGFVEAEGGFYSSPNGQPIFNLTQHMRIVNLSTLLNFVEPFFTGPSFKKMSGFLYVAGSLGYDES
jgi:hypothetical protein